jgi:hypothetical protein
VVEQRGPIAVDAGALSVVVDTELPSLFDTYVARAEFVDLVDLDSEEGGTLFFGGGDVQGWPLVVIAFRYSPAGYGFTPGVLLVPETRTLFLGGGERLLAYSLGKPAARLWTDSANTGFWGWQRHGAFVVMAAELELAVWDTSGRKLWSTFVEPPWTYSVADGLVKLDVMGTVSSFPIETGPTWDRVPWW